MDAVSYSHSAKQAQRIEKFIKNPDSNSGIVTVPKVIGAGENVTVPAGRVAVLPNVQVDGTLNVEAGGEVFIPAGATLSKVVETTGNQTVAGVKTFSSSPVVPTPTTGTQAVNKDYVDLKVALTDFTGSNQSKATNGYQKLPGGMIIQWGTTSSASPGNLTVNLPTTFPTVFLGVLMLIKDHGSSNGYLGLQAVPLSISSFSYRTYYQTGNAYFWFAIGY